MTAAGIRPPMNMAPTDTLVIEPTISMAMLGGTVSPMTAAGGENGCAFGRTVAFAELVAHHGADGGDVGGLRAGQSRDHVHARDRDLKQAALHMADQGVDEADQPDADAAALHHEAGQNEEGHGKENEVAGAVDHGLRQHHQGCRSGAPEIGRGRQQQDEADGNAGQDRDKEQAERDNDGGVVAKHR